MSEPARARLAADEQPSDHDLHPWVAKARAIDAASGGSDLSAEALARFVRILRVATAGARRAGRGRRRAGPAGRAAPRRAG